MPEVDYSEFFDHGEWKMVSKDTVEGDSLLIFPPNERGIELEYPVDNSGAKAEYLADVIWQDETDINRRGKILVTRKK